jgi:transcription antitermination factor NusG
MHPKENPAWYAMRAIFRKEMDIKNLLDKEKIVSFIPMHYTVTTKNGRKARELVPVVSNLIFVHASLEAIKKAKSKNKYLQYIVDSRSREKIIIPDQQMKHFIAVASNYNEKTIYLKPEEINLKKGTLIRIIGGVFDGVEGVFIKVKGARSRRVVVLIQGVIAVATAEIEPDLIEVIL